MDIMKALSIKQPWASLIAHGIKDIENRAWKTHFRGRIYIHASARISECTFTIGQTASLFSNEIWNPEKGFISELFVVSAIIGEVDIIDCVVNHESIWADQDAFINQGDLEAKTIYNWVLANPVLYEKPILNVKGKLSFWYPEIDIVECIGCSQKFDRETMEEDDANEKYCTECWEVLSPIMAQEAKEYEFEQIEKSLDFNL
jgi:hypothetical protein